MPERTSRIAKAYPIPADVRPRAKWERRFKQAAGFAVKVHNKYWMSVYVDPVLAGQNNSVLRKRLAVAALIARCISCVGEEWEVYSEPVDKDKVGLIVYTVKGKALAAGTGRLNARGDFVFSLSTLYRGITNKASITYTVEGTGHSDGSWEVKGTVTVSDSR